MSRIAELVVAGRADAVTLGALQSANGRVIGCEKEVKDVLLRKKGKYFEINTVMFLLCVIGS